MSTKRFCRDDCIPLEHKPSMWESLKRTARVNIFFQCLLYCFFCLSYIGQQRELTFSVPLQIKNPSTSLQMFSKTDFMEARARLTKFWASQAQAEHQASFWRILTFRCVAYFSCQMNNLVENGPLPDTTILEGYIVSYEDTASWTNLMIVNHDSQCFCHPLDEVWRKPKCGRCLIF